MFNDLKPLQQNEKPKKQIILAWLVAEASIFFFYYTSVAQPLDKCELTNRYTNGWKENEQEGYA